MAAKRHIISRRSAFACELCRERKTRCDGGYPCTRCLRFQKACVRVMSVEFTSLFSPKSFHSFDERGPNDSINNAKHYALPTISDIEKYKTAYFDQISQVFCVVDKEKFELEWCQFRDTSEASSSAWHALLFMILSLECLVSDQLSLTTSVRYEQEAWKCFTEVEIENSPSITALRALLLLSYIRACRGGSISALARMVWRVAKRLEITATNERYVFNGVVTLFSLNAKLSRAPREEWIPDEIGLQIEISESALSHAELDVIDLKISCQRVSYVDSERQLLGFVARLKDTECYLRVQQHQQRTDPTTRSLSILKARVNYLLYCIFRYTQIASSEYVQFARSVLQLFQEATWYRSGIGSLEATDCAVSLASSIAEEDVCLLRQSKEILKSITPCSNISRDCLPRFKTQWNFTPPKTVFKLV